MDISVLEAKLLVQMLHGQVNATRLFIVGPVVRTLYLLLNFPLHCILKLSVITPINVVHCDVLRYKLKNIICPSRPGKRTRNQAGKVVKIVLLV